MRLLRKVVLYSGAGSHAANDALRITVGGTPSTITLTSSASGTARYHTGSGSSELLKDLVDSLGAAGATVTASIVGVNYTDTARAEGRIRLVSGEGADTIVLKWGDALTTLPDGLFGWADAYGDLTIAAGATVYSPSIHRYGWYPQLVPNRAPEHRRSWGEWLAVRGSANEDGISWGDYAERQIGFNEGLASPFLRADAAADATLQSLYGLESGTQYGHWEQFCEDLRDAETAGERDVRYYGAIADYSTYTGSYRLRPLELLSDPMSAWELFSEPGGIYKGGFSLVRDL